jgi:beta-lactamase regulating signal transducer with metallopeptidase domain
MASLMSYCVVFATLMSLLGVAAEHLLATRALPRRVVWALALTASLAYPAIRILPPPQLPPPPALRPAVTTEPTKDAQVVASSITRETATPPASPIRQPVFVQSRRHFAWPDLANWNHALKWLWVASTIGVLAFYLLAWIRLRLMSRRWMAQRVNETSVRIADNLGPAVVGLFMPQIVLPRWLLSAPPEQRRMAVDHERQHIVAKDPLLLHVALLLVALAPWNLLLWWQLRRLRFSIEVDCDRRLLRGGINARDYGEMLLIVGQRQQGSMSGVLALTERTSQLERRIRIFTGAAGRRTLCGFLGLLAVSISLAVVAQQVKAPNIMLASELRKTFREYTGAAVRKAREISRSQFPELFAKEMDGTAVVVVVFNNDGTVFASTKKQGSAQDLPDMLDQWAKSIPQGADPEDIASVQTTDAPSGAWADSQNPYRVVLVTKVLRWPIDPTRSASRVRQAVQNYFSDLAHSPANSLSLITVLMNEDGTVNRGFKKVSPSPWAITTGDEKYSDPSVTAEQIGRSGLTQDGASEGRFLYIRYAWPRRATDPAAHTDESESVGNWWWTKNDIAAFLKSNADAAQEQTPQDRAILARYFPDALTNGLPDGQGAWVLLARDGRILATGTSIFGHAWSSLFLDKELTTRYPGLAAHPCDQVPPRRIAAASGRSFRLLYECVAIDSSLTQIAGVEPSKDTDVLIDGYIYTDKPSGAGDRKVHYPYWWTGKFGQASPNHSSAVLEIIASDVGAQEVELQVRQRTNWQAAWSDWTAPIRVRYGGETDIDVPGQNDAPIKVDLRPIRLNANNERFANDPNPGRLCHVGTKDCMMPSEMSVGTCLLSTGRCQADGHLQPASADSRLLLEAPASGGATPKIVLPLAR